MFLDEPSVTGTENAVMAATLAKGRTLIRNAAAEPHVQDLCNLLNQMGARIQGIGTHVLEIEGVEELHGTRFRLGASPRRVDFAPHRVPSEGFWLRARAWPSSFSRLSLAQ